MQANGASLLTSNKKRPRIGVDFHTFDGIFQGSRSHVLALFREVIIEAPEFDFIFFLSNPERLRAEHPEFIQPNVRLVSMKHRSGVARLGLQLPWLQLKYRLDLLHTQYRIPFIPLGKCACTIHDVLFESHPEYFSRFFTLQSKLSMRMAAKLSSLLFSVSQFSKNEIAQRYGLSSESIKVIYNGVDRQRFFPAQEGDRSLIEKLGLTPQGYLLTVGRLEPRKNHLRLIEAYSLLGNDAPPLVCVGQRDFGYDKALDAAKHFGVEKRVIFMEKIGDDLLPVIIRNAKLFVYPAMAEGFGMPVAEALASGVPVVTSNTTSLPEVAGDAAVLIDPSNASSIADGMKQILDNPGVIPNLLDKGFKQVQLFDWRLSAKIAADSYRALLLP